MAGRGPLRCADMTLNNWCPPLPPARAPALPAPAVQSVATIEATMSMSDISLSETSPAAAPAPARPPLPTEPPPFSAAAAAQPAHAEAGAAAAAPSRELSAEQRADLAQLSQQVPKPYTRDSLLIPFLGFRVKGLILYPKRGRLTADTLSMHAHQCTCICIHTHMCVLHTHMCVVIV